MSGYITGIATKVKLPENHDNVQISTWLLADSSPDWYQQISDWYIANRRQLGEMTLALIVPSVMAGDRTQSVYSGAAGNVAKAIRNITQIDTRGIAAPVLGAKTIENTLYDDFVCRAVYAGTEKFKAMFLLVSPADKFNRERISCAYDDAADEIIRCAKSYSDDALAKGVDGQEFADRVANIIGVPTIACQANLVLDCSVEPDSETETEK